MGTCIFFGHRIVRRNLEDELYTLVCYLITNQGYDTFYVGNHGDFDGQVRRILKKAKENYPHIQYAVVLAYLPRKENELLAYDTLYPEGLELVPPRFAITKRNAWMLSRADCIISYITHHGNAENLVNKAKRKGKIVYNLPEMDIPLLKNFALQ